MPRWRSRPWRVSSATLTASALLLLGSGLTLNASESAVTADFPFPIGEELEYRIYWGPLPVGDSVVTSAWVQEDGRQLLKIAYRTKSNKVIATIYPVDDVIEAVIDPATLRPVRFTKNLKEGRHRVHETTFFDYDRMKAKWVSYTKEKEKEYDIQEDTRDLVSFMYYMRSYAFTPGEEMQFKVMADEKIYELFIKAHNVERIKTGRHGRVESIKLEPKAKFDGLFVRKGRMTVWVSTDARRVCTRMAAEVPVASVRVVLHEVRGPGDDSWVSK